MGDDLLYPPKQRSWNFLNFQEMIWRSGSTVWTKFSNSKTLPKPKKFLWPPTTWKERPTSGGSGFVGHSRKMDTGSYGRILRINSGLASGLRSAKILTKPFRGQIDWFLAWIPKGIWTLGQLSGWTQKALMGTFMGGLRIDISDEIRMFKPQTLKDAISFARMRDDQLVRQPRFIRPSPPVWASLALPLVNRTIPIAPAALARCLSWEEMQRKRF